MSSNTKVQFKRLEYTDLTDFSDEVENYLNNGWKIVVTGTYKTSTVIGSEPTLCHYADLIRTYQVGEDE